MEVDESSIMDLQSDMINYLVVNEKIVFKSQQRGEPDLTSGEKSQIALSCLEKSRIQFLSRFGDYLHERHLKFFDNCCLDEKYEVDFYVNKIKQRLSAAKNKVVVRNRRFNALKCLANEGDYFSEGEMKKRNPLLYDHLVGQYLTEEERHERESFANVRCEMEEDGGYRLSTLLMEQWERDQAGDLKKKQQEKEEEEELDTDSDGAEDSYCDLWGETKCKENRVKIRKDNEERLTNAEKRLMMHEFQTHAFASFLAGDDSQFDYESVDNNMAYDDLEEINREEEEKYFDSESIDEIEMRVSANDFLSESGSFEKASSFSLNAKLNGNSGQIMEHGSNDLSELKVDSSLEEEDASNFASIKENLKHENASDYEEITEYTINDLMVQKMKIDSQEKDRVSCVGNLENRKGNFLNQHLLKQSHEHSSDTE